jgi:predicted membrane chloride channel (bestrophin family)
VQSDFSKEYQQPFNALGESIQNTSLATKMLSNFLLAARPGNSLHFSGRDWNRKVFIGSRRASHVVAGANPLNSRLNPLHRINSSHAGSRAPSNSTKMVASVALPTRQKAFWNLLKNKPAVRKDTITKTDAKRKREVIIHDDIMIRQGCGRDFSFPRAERYTTSDWKHILQTTPKSVVLKRIRGPVLTNMAWAAIVWVAFKYLNLPQRFCTEVHNLVGSALGLLLVFRTNKAYERFWEGCKVWENLLGEARDLARMSMMYHKEITREKVHRVANLICLFSSLLADHLGHTVAKKNQYSSFATSKERAQLEKFCNHPLWALNKLGQEVKEIPDVTEDGESQPRFSSRERLTMLKHVDIMSRVLGKCERLVQTPVPLNYVRHTSRVLAFWCFTLPFALTGGLGLLAIPVVAMLTCVLYGIQEIGLMIEDPFRDALDLNVFVEAIICDVFATTSMIEPREDTQLSIR